MKQSKMTWRRLTRAPSAMHGVAAFALLGGAVGAGCSGVPGPTEDIGTTSQALTATISGTVFGSNGQPLLGATVTLSGNATGTTTTNAAGQYSFNVSTGSSPTGSFDLRATDPNCSNFNPSGGFIALNGIRGSSANNNFTGVGSACVSAQFDAGASAATDPGPRQGAAGAGCAAATQPIAFDDPGEIAKAAVCCLPNLSNVATAGEPGVTINESTIAGTLEYCAQAVIRLQEVDSVSGTFGTDTGVGLGPTFNSNGCATCHSEPGVLGSSPSALSPQVALNNPQIAAATRAGATNIIPPFISLTGPVREARFPIAAGGGVGDLFTINGRSDTPAGCTLQQPNFAQQIANNDIIFRIPTPTFGGGLVENVQEQTLEANLNVPPAGAPSNASLGISGVLNRSGNDGTITRFGWKAQNKSLLIFAGEAYNVEQGVSNEVFPNERHGSAVNEAAACFNINGTPEDATNFAGNGKNTVSDVLPDVADFAVAMRLSAPPVQATAGYTAGFVGGSTTSVSTTTVSTGQQVFVTVGCGNCHSPTLTTGPLSSQDPALANVVFHPYSDFAVHHMGTGLADGVSQGNAGGDQFRSAPLWGVGQRIFFLHDGRETSIVQAIEDHASSGSEATTVVENFNALSAANQQAIVDFLRSL
jgi:CxxC motif-containing protein (DUF1111 family)